MTQHTISTILRMTQFPMTPLRLTFAVLLASLASAQFFAAVSAQEAEDTTLEPPTTGPVAKADAKPGEKKEEKKEEPEPEPVRRPKVELPPRYLMLRLQDGSAIAGELSVNEVKVKTEFGELVVPVAKIRSFTPGLGSKAKLAEELTAKIKELGSDDYKTRELAHKDLAAMGPRIAKQLEPHFSSENAEIKRHISEIMKEFEEQAEESDEEDEAKPVDLLIDLDTIETHDFTVLGRISPLKFEMNSKYGPLSIALGDVIRAERPVDTRESIRKSITVPGENLAQRSFKSTGIRLRPGDRVSITASGQITMTPWGTNARSGPDGMPNYGWYTPNAIAGGALVGRIGDKGQIFKVGTKHSFTAKTTGTLQLAIGMTPEYANEGYNYPGEYKTKIKVD